MNRRKSISRRDILAVSMLLPAIADSKAAPALPNTVQHVASNVLVAYFSRSGNTRVVAGQIHRALGTALFEIRPATPYPEDYEQTVEQARRERDRGYHPPLGETVPNLASYTTVFLGFPIWGETVPPVVRSFLSSHDLSGKTLIPFITHGGYGLGNSLSVIASLAPRAKLLDGFSMQADQERQTLTRVTRWLGEIKSK
jgi:flavodoxin